MSKELVCLRCTLPFCREDDKGCLYRIERRRDYRRQYRKQQRRKREAAELKQAILEILAKLKKVKYDRERYLRRKTEKDQRQRDPDRPGRDHRPGTRRHLETLKQ